MTPEALRLCTHRPRSAGWRPLTLLLALLAMAGATPAGADGAANPAPGAIAVGNSAARTATSKTPPAAAGTAASTASNTASTTAASTAERTATSTVDSTVNSTAQRNVETPAHPPAAAGVQCPRADDGAALPNCCCATLPLRQIDAAAFRLPYASTTRRYSHPLQGEGGTPPYRYRLSSGQLPPGLTLQDDGMLAGRAEKSGTWRFTIALGDSSGAQAEQPYTLYVLAPKPKPAPSEETPATNVEPATPPAPAPLKTLTLAQSQDTAAGAPQTLVTVYRLVPAVLDELVPSDPTPVYVNEPSPDPTAAEPTAEARASTLAATATVKGGGGKGPPVALNSAQVEQLRQMLTPLLNVEFPNRSLFGAALDAQLCRLSSELTLKAAESSGAIAPSGEQLAAVCPPDGSASAGSDDTGAASDTLPWQQLPATLLPPALRRWLIDNAAQHYALQPWQTLRWQETSCGCVLPGLGQNTYGFYPLWWARSTPQDIDFSLLGRIAYFAIPFDTEGNLPIPDLSQPGIADFARTAQRHRTQIDLTLYRNDWEFLRKANASTQTRIAEQLARQAVQLIDLPLPDPYSRAKAWVPGFAETPRLADGLTLYFDALPSAQSDPALAAAFQHFLHQLLPTLIKQMRLSPRHYALNLVMQDQQLYDPQTPWTVETLFETLKQAEDPPIVDQRIAGDGAQYQSHTNLQLHYLVLLSEPSSQSKKRLRQYLEASPLLLGGDRRIVLRKVLPILATGVSSARQFDDDLAYAADNFGGIGFWPTPIAGETATAEHLDTLRNSFLSNKPRAESLRAWICLYRWPLRVLFELLLLIGGIAFALFYGSCRIRALGSLYQGFLLLGCIPTVVVGALLLEGDPALRSLRQGDTLFWLLIAALILTALGILLKPRIDPP